MKYKGIIKGSRTVDAAALIGALGVVETKFQYLQGMLGEYYGVSYVVVAAVMYYLRTITTKPMQGKTSPRVKNGSR